METRRNYNIPISIVVGCLIIGMFYNSSQKRRDESLQKQYELKISQQESSEQAERERRRAIEKFNNNLKCQDLLDDLKKRWGNIVGIYYSEEDNTCIVKFRKKSGLIDEAPMEEMEDAK